MIINLSHFIWNSCNKEFDKADKFITHVVDLPRNSLFMEEVENFFNNTRIYIVDKAQKALDFMDLWDKYDNKIKKEIFNMSTYIKMMSYNQFVRKYRVNLPSYAYKMMKGITFDKILLAKTYFPYKKGLDYSKLRISKEGYYSISRPFLGAQIIKIIKESVGSDLKKYKITDATGGNGGDSIYFAQNFKFVNIVEINKEHCDIIEYNMKLYELKNWNIHCKPYEDVMSDLDQDIVYIDAPWGGKDKINLPENNVKLGRYYMYQLANYIMFNFDVKYVVFKLPPNYALSKYYKYIDNSLMTVKVFNVYDNMMVIVNSRVYE